MLKLKSIISLIIIAIFCFSGMLIAETYSTPDSFNEAPMLEEKVQNGELPPVEERLPDEPFVVGSGTLIREQDIDWQVGSYGGGKLVGSTAWEDNDPDLRDAMMEHLVNTPRMQTGPITGNIVQDFEISDDNQEFTFTLRKGLKWSDGEPVTTEDVRFAIEDVLMNTDITPVFPTVYRSGGIAEGEPMKLEIVDKYTFKLTFSRPYGGFLNSVGVGGQWAGDYNDLIKPKHYLTQYHNKYTSIEEMKEDLEEEGLSEGEWGTLFEQKDIAWYENTSKEAVGFPVLTPWMRVEGPDGRIVCERNPYYFKVDTEGNQLPYIDKYESVVVNDVESIPLKVISGEVNMLRIRATLNKMPLYKDNEQEAGYKTLTSLKMHNAPIGFFLNYTYDDPVWKEISRDVRFRRAVNMAIDREQIIGNFFFGLAKMNKWVPQKYDPEQAEKLLDEMGMYERDSDGNRLGPDGNKFDILINVSPVTPDWIPIAELIAANLREIGIKTRIKQISRELWTERRDNNRLQASIDWIDSPNWPILVNDYLPADRAGYGLLWDDWYMSDGEEGEEPPSWAKQAFEFYERVKEIRPDSEKAENLTEDFSQWMHEEVIIYPLLSDVTNPIIIPENLGNVANSGMGSATHFVAEQFYFKNQ